MIPLLEQHREEVVALCEKFGVQRLDLFGSAAKGTFDPETSDLDFVVDFEDYGPGIARRFMGFADAMEALFGRHVDLVFDAKMENPYFRKSVNAHREKFYDATDRQTAA